MDRALIDLLERKVVVIDGSTGVLIQSRGLSEADFRGERLAAHPRDLKGNYDILCLTKPEFVASLHEEYFRAGADVVKTDSFTATWISQAEYGTEGLVREMNRAAASIARGVADRFTALEPEKPRLVAGSIGPTNRTASISPVVEDPGARNVTYDELEAAYREQAEGLIEGGVDCFLIETVFDGLNAKAAVRACNAAMDSIGRELPILVSVTLTDKSGRTLSGQTLEAFCVSVINERVVSIGLNCSFGAAELLPFVRELSRREKLFVSVHPNAGLPDQMGRYVESPERTAELLGQLVEAGEVNMVGGCCGTRPEHIAAIAAMVERARRRGISPRRVPEGDRPFRLAGMEALTVLPGASFINVGERCNVAGSARFAKMIREGRYSDALEVARAQVEAGAQVIDVNMDDGLLDAEKEMTTFVRLLASEPDIARLPLMIDSSRWEVLLAGLKAAQGKPILNSLSLKAGEDAFRAQAREARALGAAIVVMAFDERGQADSLERRREIFTRAWRILVEDVGFPAQDVILDPNVLAVATGMAEHDRYALDFIESVRWIKANLPGAKVSGGISNLSFSFRGNDRLRQAMHTVFLRHAIAAGMDMGIVNPAQTLAWEDIEPELLELVEDVILARRSDAAERLGSWAQEKQAGTAATAAGSGEPEWRKGTLRERIAHALLSGVEAWIEEDALAALAELGSSLAVIEGPLMEGMSRVGELFGEGKMFLPQVVKSARVMKRAVKALEPAILAEKAAGAARAGKVLMATVKGDVHDIGKNIVSVVLGCNGFEVLDLGVMVPCADIVDRAVSEGVDAIGLSGLITPSLLEMAEVASELERRGLDIPLMVGGATTSKLHTALKLAPLYSGGVVHVLDASRSAAVARELCDPAKRGAFLASVAADQERLRRESVERDRPRLLSLEEARRKAFKPSSWPAHAPAAPGRGSMKGIPIGTLRPLIDWSYFFLSWDMGRPYPQIMDDPRLGEQARKLKADAEALLDAMEGKSPGLPERAVRSISLKVSVNAAWFVLPAHSCDEDIVVRMDDPAEGPSTLVMPTLRRQELDTDGLCPSLADFVAPEGHADWIGGFAVTAGIGAAAVEASLKAAGDDYAALLFRLLTDRLAEAAAEWLHREMRLRIWGFAPDEALSPQELFKEGYRGIRPAVGYPVLPDHSLKRRLFSILDADGIGIGLTESCMMDPAASVSGLVLAHPQARYFAVGRIGEDQLADYARRAGMSMDEARRWLSANL